MAKYGFNENEIVATKTIQIDKDGFYKEILNDNGNSDDSGNSDNNPVQEKDYLVMLSQYADPSNANNILIKPEVWLRNGGEIYNRVDGAEENFNGVVGIKPYNTMTVSDIPSTIENNPSAQQTFNELIGRVSSDTSTVLDAISNASIYYVDGVPHYRYVLGAPNAPVSTALTLSMSDLVSLGVIEKISDGTNETSTLYHYEFDLILALLSIPSEETTEVEVHSEVLHVITPQLSESL